MGTDQPHSQGLSSPPWERGWARGTVLATYMYLSSVNQSILSH